MRRAREQRRPTRGEAGLRATAAGLRGDGCACGEASWCGAHEFGTCQCLYKMSLIIDHRTGPFCGRLELWTWSQRLGKSQVILGYVASNR